MKIPQKIKIKILEKISLLPVPGVYFEIELIAQFKNNYFIGPFITDSFGESIITKDIIIQQINRDKDFYMMDYASDIDDCDDEIIIHVLSGESIRQKINNVKKYFPENAELLNALFSVSINERFTVDIIKKLGIKEELKFEI